MRRSTGVLDIPRVSNAQFDAVLRSLLNAGPMPMAQSYRRCNAYPWLMN